MQWNQAYADTLHMYCESPIEAGFFRAYTHLIGPDSDEVRYHITDKELRADRFLEEYLSFPQIQPWTLLHKNRVDFIGFQVPVDPFRVDFMLGRFSYNVQFVNDRPGPEVMVRSPIVVVECDGHDFHERTKAQAQRDKSRDRVLVDRGYRVIRFTGSEIHRDAAKCAREVDAMLARLSGQIVWGDQHPK